MKPTHPLEMGSEVCSQTKGPLGHSNKPRPINLPNTWMKVGNIGSLEGGGKFTTYMKAFGQNTTKRSQRPLGHPLTSIMFFHVAHIHPKPHRKKKGKGKQAKKHS
jgi:hypothetical protein